MGKRELHCGLGTSEVEEKAFNLTPPPEALSLLLGASGGEGGSVSALQSAGFPQAAPTGEVLPCCPAGKPVRSVLQVTEISSCQARI